MRQTASKPSARTVPALIDEIAAHEPAATFVVDGDRRWSYAEFVGEIAHTSAALERAGVGRGDRIGILAGNRAEWLMVYFAAMSRGAIGVGLNTWSTAHELAYQLNHARVKFLFLETLFRERDFVELINVARTLESGLPHLAQIVSFDAGDTRARFFDDWRGRLPDSAVIRLNDPNIEIIPADVACLLYTSGSTALPKGVPLLHHGLIDNMWEIGERQHLRRDDRLWLGVSLFWSLASVNAVFAILTHGGTIVLQHHFDADLALRLIESERCSIFYGTPNMALAMTENPKLTEFDLSSLRTGVTIGTEHQVRRVAELGVERICNVYGLTEAYGNSTVTDAELPLAKRIATVGNVLAGQELKIVDPQTFETLATDAVGEIVLRGNVTPGYWEDPTRTAEAFSDDGWFRTGDLGLVDEHGYLYYRGRLKEMVKTGGINVAPAEVEAVLSAYPAVELAFVTGVADERLDEALAAVIVLRNGQTCDADDLVEHCRAVLATYKTPRHFRFVAADDLPLTTTGKLQRNRLMDFFDRA